MADEEETVTSPGVTGKYYAKLVKHSELPHPKRINKAKLEELYGKGATSPPRPKMPIHDDFGGIYNGEAVEGLPHGFGTMRWPSGDSYEGTWEMGQKHGRGKATFTDGGWYEGDYTDDLKHGRGTYNYADGRRYEGMFKDGVSHGRGTYIYSDGGTYEGDWMGGEKHGYGVMVWPEGDTYDGTWKMSQKHGRGVAKFSDGGSYEGEYRDDEKHGVGIYNFADGRRYEGGWSAGVPEGKGKLFLPDGSLDFDGMFKNGMKEETDAAPSAPEAAAAPAEAEAAAPAVPEVEGSLPEDTNIVFVLGGPGSGKGTQCEQIVAKYGHQHLSAGDLLRAEVAAGTETGTMCETLMKEGKLVPMEVTIGLLKAAMIKSGAKDFLIDGFPRALDQAQAFEAQVMPCKKVLFFDCPLETMQDRLLKRGETSGRADDNIETIKKRFDTFTNQSLPVVSHYEAQGKAFKVSAVPAPDEVFVEVCKVMDGEAAAPAAPAVPEVEGSLPEDTNIVFVLGGPGSGKGTQCEQIVAKYGHQHLSAGDLLRAEVAAGTETGTMCETLMKEGKLVPMEVTIGLLKAAMIKSGAKDFLIDGFPRALDQAQAFEAQVMPCKKVLFFDCPLETMQDRLLKRGETSGRADDNIETIKKRFDTFTNQSLPVVTHYEAQGKAFKVSAVPAPDEVFVEVCKVMDGEAAAPAAPAVPEVEGSLPEDTNIVFVLGGPGSGKGTQCEQIVAKYGHQHLSAGDLLRAEVAAGTETGTMCETLMKEGKLVPMEVTIGLLKAAMIKSGAKDFLIDGFPRALDQAQAFEAQVMPCKKVLFFDCPLETMQDRLLKRGETSGRADDNIETIKKRFDTFTNQSLPVVTHYEAQGKAFKVSAVPAPDEVFVEVCKVMDGEAAAPAAPAVPEVEGSLPEDTNIVFVLGGPGSGKGTQCEQIVAKYGHQHLSAGDLLRAEVAAGTETGTMCETLMKEGKLVPMEVTIGLLKAAMIKSGAKDFLIDGFPRALDQAQAFEAQVMPCKKVLFFDCPLETMQDRLLKRGETSGRADDNIETIKKRFDTFTNQSLPVVTHYEAQGKAFKVSAVPAPDEVFVEVCKVMDGEAAAPAAPAVPEVEGSLPEDTNIVFVLGGPGSGKGTQCEQIVAKYGHQHLSAGDLLRAEVAAGTETGTMCETLMKEGKLVPMEVTIGLLKAAMIKSGAKDFLIDGFPRALDQAQAFEAQVMPCKKVLFFDCPLETMQDRLLKRGETSGRADDNIETIKKRFDTFTNQSLPVVTHYEAQGKAFKVSAVPAPDEVFVEVCKVMDGEAAAPAASAEEGEAAPADAEAAVPAEEGEAAPAEAAAPAEEGEAAPADAEAAVPAEEGEAAPAEAAAPAEEGEAAPAEAAAPAEEGEAAPAEAAAPAEEGEAAPAEAEAAAPAEEGEAPAE